MSLYLDYNASSPVDSQVIDIMFDVYRNVVGNADSRTHEYGDRARDIVETSRKKVANLLQISSSEVFFTSGATESNNIAIQGLRDYAASTGKKHIITSGIEHKAVLETVRAMEKNGYEVDFVKPDISGRINSDDVLSKVREDTLLVSIMHVNNETGIIQPVSEIGEELSQKEILFHVDATQSVGKLVSEIRKMPYDMMSFSAHKLHGPQGIGVLVLRRKHYKLPPVRNIIYGGQQEHGIRPGTVPVALAAGCGKACEIAQDNYVENEKKVRQIKKELINALDESQIEYYFNGDQNYCLHSVANVYFPGIMSEALMISTKNLCGISNGSACTSKDYSPSYVLSAMGMPVDRIESSVRISWGPDTNINIFSNQFRELLKIAKQLKT